jgi:hypothetical protein
MPAEWMMLYALLAATPGAAAAAPQDPAPSAEMLEFLGNWETAKGESVDPAQFADTASADTAPLVDKPSEDSKHDKHE